MAATIILIVLLSLTLFAGIIKHGEERGKWNFWWTLVNVALYATLYYFAGVFDNLK